MKGLVISGGGSKGAFGGGVVEYLGGGYDLYIGTSTGSLMVPLVAANNIDKLKHAYTNIQQKHIFKINPFKIKTKKDGSVDVKINYLNVFYNLVVRRKKSFGDSSSLRELIDMFITQSDFDKIKATKNDVLVCVTNSTLGVAEYKSIHDFSLGEFHDWIWASTSAYPFMDSLVINNYEYIDGGFTDPSPIQEAINRGCEEIDCIILRTENGNLLEEKLKNPLQGLGRIIDIMLSEINNNDIQIASLNAINKDVRLNLYYTPRILTNNSLVFNKQQMEKWWVEGFESAKNKHNVSYLIRGDELTNKLIYRKSN